MTAVSVGYEGEDRQIVLHFNGAVLGQHLQRDLVRRVVIRHIPEKGARQDSQDQQDDPPCQQQLFPPGHSLPFHVRFPHCSSWGRYARMV